MSHEADAQRAHDPGKSNADTGHIDLLRRALARPLPGLAAQLHMAPAYRAEALQNRAPPENPRQAAVLVLLYARAGELLFPLTRRTDTVENHKGQISLPGGAREGTETLQHTALRETCEELATCYDELTPIGSLSPLYVPPSGFLIHPFVAYADMRPGFKPDPVEVAELIEVPLSNLLDPRTEAQEEWVISGSPVKVPFYHIFGHKVWGATAMVLAELVAILREVQI